MNESRLEGGYDAARVEPDAPNERIILEEFKRGIEQTARVYLRMNELQG